MATAEERQTLELSNRWGIRMRVWINSLFIITHTVVMVAGLCIPLYLVARCFFGDDGVPTETWTGILASVGRWPSLLFNTAVVCAVAAVAAVGSACVFAPLIFRTDLPGRNAAIGVLVLVTCLPMYVTETALLSVVGIPRCRESLIAAGVLHGIVLAAPASLLIGIGLRGVDRPLEETALLDTTARDVLRYVSLPTARWSIVVAILLVAFLSGTDYFLTDILQVRTFAEEIYTQYALRGTAQVPILLSVPLILGLLAAVAFTLVSRPRPRRSTVAGEWPLPRVFRLGSWTAASAVVVAGMLLTFGAIPLVSIIGQIGSRAGFVEGFRAVRSEFVNSLWLCFGSASLCAVLATGLAWTAVRGRPLTWVARIFVVGLLAVPAPALGITLIEMLNRPGPFGLIYDSPAILIIGQVARFLPLAAVFMIPAVERIPQGLEDAARMEGCTVFELHRFVYWPMCFRDLRITWLLVLVLTFGETACSVLIAPPGCLTLSVRFFTLLHYGIYRDAAVICILAVLAIMVPWLLLTFFERLFHGNRT